MEPNSSRLSRELINLFIGMSLGDPNLPRTLRDGGYTCHSIEPTFPLSATKSANPEMLLVSQALAHTLILEAKSGANLSDDQLLRYSWIAGISLAQAAQVPIPADESYDLLIVGLEEFSDRLKMGTAKTADPRRTLAVRTETGITHLEGDFSVDDLNAGFVPELKIDWDLIPIRYLPVDFESQDWQFAEYLIPEILAKVLSSEDEVGIEDLAKSVIPYWQFIAAAYKQKLRSRMLEVLRRASSRHFKGLIAISAHKKANAKVTFLEHSFSTPAKLQSALNLKYKRFMDDLQSPQMEFAYEDPSLPPTTMPTPQ